MIVWRISHHATLDGRGGLKASARWHNKGCRIVYCAPNPAAALLELLVHAEIDLEDFPGAYTLLKIEIPHELFVEELDLNVLPQGWAQSLEVTRAIGDEWLVSMRSALLRVPCVIVPETWNVLINPTHEHSQRIQIVDSQRYAIYGRLLSS